MQQHTADVEKKPEYTYYTAVLALSESKRKTFSVQSSN